jgi:outer membrane immunogenic protein
MSRHHRFRFRAALPAAALGACLATAASAADMPVKTPDDPPAMAANWSGHYVGVSVGFRASDADATVTSASRNGTDLTALPPFGSCASGFLTCNEPLDGIGWKAGLYAGYNWQLGSRFVGGIEVDASWADQTTALPGVVYPTTFLITSLAADQFGVRTTWDASLRGRFGWLATPTVLVYATGGAAWLHAEAISTCANNVSPFSCSDNSIVANLVGLRPATISNARILAGWTAGGGIEMMLWPNWIARAEYRYSDYGTLNVTDTRTGTAGTEVVSYDIRMKTHAATFGLAYRFGADRGAPPALFMTADAAPTEPVSWNGFHLGIGAGLRASETTPILRHYFIGDFDMAGLCQSGLAVCGLPQNGNAYRIGAYLGHDWQFARRFVAGMEMDWSYADQTTTTTGSALPGTLSGGLASDQFSVKTGWDASARLRLGWLARPSVLVYGTGGATALHVKTISACSTETINGNCAGHVRVPAVVTDTANRLGWTAGGGLEAMVWSRWMLRGEYRYSDYGTFGFTNFRVTPFGPEAYSYDLRLKTHTLTFGIARKFGGPLLD